MDLNGMLATARGETRADLLLLNASIVNTFTAEIEMANVAICRERIAGVGNYLQGKEIIDLNGKYLMPGLIDGHVHLESSLVTPSAFAEAVVPRGVLTVVTDFHEIANVCGVAGIEYMLEAAEALPLDIFVMIPSCVPATHMETAGASITVADIKKLMRLKNVIGLGEVMDFPGVISGDRDVLTKIEAFHGRVIDGHAPGVVGAALNAYLSCGIRSDHECTTLDEAREKLSKGMYIMIREGSSEKNLDALLPMVTDETFKRCFFVVDDRDCVDLLRDGEIDAVARKAIDRGLGPIRAIQMTTINTAEYFRLSGLGAVAPGYRANLVVFDDINQPRARMVFYDGRLVAQDGNLTITHQGVSDSRFHNTINFKPFEITELEMPVKGKLPPVIEIIPDQVITRKREEILKVEGGLIHPDIERDILKLVVVERHRATGNIGLGLVKGFGLKRGALGSSIAHDSHNIVAVGTNDLDIFTAIMEIGRIQGGMVIAKKGRVLNSLPLLIAGLLSQQPLAEVVFKIEELVRIAKSLGCSLVAPFDTLSMLALPVIPEIRLTDLGLVDVLSYKLLTD